MSKQKHPTCEVIIYGSENVGKKTLIDSYLNKKKNIFHSLNKEVQTKTKKIKILDSKKYHVNISSNDLKDYDVANQNPLDETISIFAYDITNRQSFQLIKQHLTTIDITGFEKKNKSKIF